MHARNWNIQPSEFWEMTLPEWFLEYELHREHDQTTDYAGNLTRGDVDELSDDFWLGDDEWLEGE